jgi:hypothetical protein
MKVLLAVLLKTIVALASLAAAPTRAQGDSKENIDEYLYNLGSGPMAANEIIQLDGSAVTNIQTSKELVFALGSLGNQNAQGGFGIAFTPGRSRFDTVAVSLANYTDPNKLMNRLWGNTTFSYAQNKLSKGGTDYAQNALALNLSYYLNAGHDPVVAARNAISTDIDRSGSCKAVFARIAKFHEDILARGLDQKQRLGLKADQELPAQAMAQLNAEAAKWRLDQPPQTLANRLPAELRAQRNGAIKSDDPTQMATDLKACADKAQTAAQQKWNASQLTVVLGQGWIKGAQANAERLSLGKHATLALAYSPKETENSLFNLSLRRIRRELDLDTLTTTPAYKNTTIAAARYTYGQPGTDTYGLAEISNVKASSATLSNAAFKLAVGVDHKLAGGIWLEFRLGRSRVADGSQLENKALFNLKFSPESTLDGKKGL